MAQIKVADRMGEWYVPKWGPQRLRAFLGLLFLPYTGMVLSYATIGSLLAREVRYDRVAAIVFIYFCGLGIAAHALDALGSATKPWGRILGRRELWALAAVALVLAYAPAVYYMVVAVPLLSLFAVLEGFFVFAYNLEWFGGAFHTDRWFAFSWGGLPVLSGYVMQTNRVSASAVLVALSMALLSMVEIKASRPYKELKRLAPAAGSAEFLLLERYEAILKSVSLGVIALGCALLLWRVAG